MLIKIMCKCGQKLQVKEKDAGKKAPCPTCGAAVTVPSAEPSEAILPNRPLPAIRVDVSATTPAEDDTYGLALEVARPDLNESLKGSCPPPPVASAPVPIRTALLPQISRLVHKARGNGPSRAHLCIGGLLLTIVTIGAASGAWFSVEAQRRAHAPSGKSPIFSSFPDRTRAADKKFEASEAPRGSGQDDTFQAVYKEGKILLDDGELKAHYHLRQSHLASLMRRWPTTLAGLRTCVSVALAVP